MTTSVQGQPHPPDKDLMVTSCGRHVTVKRLELPIPERHISRVTLDLGPGCGGVPGVWAAFTSREARDLARRLLAQADLAERDGPGTAGASASTSSGAPAG